MILHGVCIYGKTKGLQPSIIWLISNLKIWERILHGGVVLLYRRLCVHMCKYIYGAVQKFNIT